MTATQVEKAANSKSREYREMPLDEISNNPYNPRENPADFDDLLQSVKEEGIRTPLTVFRSSKGGYIVADGHRRLACARHLKMAYVPVYIDHNIKSVQDATLYALLEGNMSRPYTPIEQARAYKALIEELKMEPKEVARYVGVSEGTVSNYLLLLKWGDGVQKLIHEEDLPPSVAWTAQREIKRISEKDKKKLPEAYVRTGLEKKLLSRSLRRMSDQNALREFTDNAKTDEIRRWLGSPSESAKAAMMRAGRYGSLIKMLKGVLSSITRLETPPSKPDQREELIRLLRSCREGFLKAERVIQGKEVAVR